MSNRAFSNNYPDYDGSNLSDKDKVKKQLNDEISRQLDNLYKGLDQWLDWNDYSVYTGTTGIALLHFHLDSALGNKQDKRYLEKALYYVEKPLKHLKRRKASFLCGDGGPLALGAVLYDKLGKEKDRDKCLERLLSRLDDVLSDESIPDELLFGRVGYLYSLLFVQQHLGKQTVDDKLITKLCEGIISSGVTTARNLRSSSPLMYEWHDKQYLGAAHGLVGIFHVLMQVEGFDDRRIPETIDHLMSLRFATGNYPSSIGSATGDKLVHWCHGAPGWIHMFAQAYKRYGSEKYLEAAVSCGEVIWERGLLKKGYGLCHGVAGNAYGFLTLYKLTKDQKHLYRAHKFAEWCMDYGKHGCPSPDRPFSLFEGLAGTIYFLLDLLEPENSKFPAFDL